MRRIILAVSVIGLLAGCTSGGSGTASAPAAAPATVTPPVAVASVPSAASAPGPSATTSTGPSSPTSTSAASSPKRTPSHSSKATAPPSSSSSTAPAPSSTVSFPAGSGPVVVLDPGHNGGNETHISEIDRLVPAGFGVKKPCNTTGTNTDAGYPEHAFTWDVSLRVRKILTAHGVRVVLTRSNDTSVGPCVNVRAQIQSEAGVAAAIAIHADGAPSAGHGFHVCYASRRPAGSTAATSAKSRALSTAVHNSLAGGSGLVTSTYIGSDGYYPRSDLAGLNLSTSPTTFLELGNMRNAHDAALQSSSAGRQRIAAAVAAGILAYLGR